MLNSVLDVDLKINCVFWKGCEHLWQRIEAPSSLFISSNCLDFKIVGLNISVNFVSAFLLNWKSVEA